MRGERGVTHTTLEQETTAHVPFQPRKTVLELFKVVFVFWEQLRSHCFFSLNPNMWQGLCPNKAGQQTHSGSSVPLRRGMSRDIPCIYNLSFFFFLTVHFFVRLESILVLCLHEVCFFHPNICPNSEYDTFMRDISPPH